MLEGTNVIGIVLLALGAVLVGVSIVALVLRSRTRGAGPEVPYGMRPGPSDAALETPLLQRYQGWGVVLVAFFVVWFPLSWLIEPDRNLTQEQELHELALARGERAVQPFSEENQLGVGCTGCHGSELQGGVVFIRGEYRYPPTLQNICAGNLGQPKHPQIASVDDIYQVIYEGRIEAGMPSWSIRFAGALPDQQINDIVVYLIEMSSQHVPFEDNICLNPDAQTRALELAQQEGVVLERP
jgi:hypothetical protein